MTSVNSSPSKLKTYNPFLPNVKFPVYKFKVHIADWPVRHPGDHFQSLDSIEPPESDSNYIFCEEFIFRDVKDENNKLCLFLINPTQYLPNDKGYDQFLKDLKLAACPENYTTHAKCRDSNGLITYVSICCSHSKLRDKCVKAHGNINIPSDAYRVGWINNSMKCSCGDRRALARRSSSQYRETPCKFKGVNFYVGKKYLCLIPSNNDGKVYSDHAQFDIHDKKTYMSNDLEKTIVTVTAGRASGFNVLKPTQKLHAGGMNLSKGQANHH